LKLKQLVSDNKRLADQISILHSPPMLDQRARELNLGLSPVQPLQVVRLTEPASQWTPVLALKSSPVPQ
jgi:cell division protein FtsB